MTVTIPALTLLDRIHQHAGRRPAAQACLFVGDDGGTERVMTYAELAALMQSVATALRSRLNPGDRALLLVPEGPGFVAAFLGCLQAGIVAVPAYPPIQSRPRPDTLRAIAGDCRPAAVLVSAPEEFVAKMRGAIPELADVWWAQVDDLIATPPHGSPAYDAEPGDATFLQYTSGSTALPRGVVVTHDALAYNLEMIQLAWNQDENLRLASWLPLFHDMGLIGNVLAPLWIGGTTLLMEPLAFIKRPARWLWMISRYGAQVSGGPNFAYDLCVNRVRDDDIVDLNLGCWRSAYTGAEPIRPGTLRAFTERFAPYGFDPVSWRPVYGLAEATLLVTGVQLDALPSQVTLDAEALQFGKVVPSSAGRTLVSSGHTWLDRTVLIVDPDTRRPAQPGQVGEIWIGGPSLPAGYWENPEATEHTFAARLDGCPGEPYLRSGDLGFVHDDELYVTGRIKDVVIVGGRNHYPQDIEATVERAHPLIWQGCVVVFSIEDGDAERVVVVAGARQQAAGDGEKAARKRTEIVRAVRSAAAAEHGIPIDDVVIVSRTAVPKTSSGKVQRGACRMSYLRGDYTYPDESRVKDET